MKKYVDIYACIIYLFSKFGLSTVSSETVFNHMADYADHNSADVAPRAEVERLEEELEIWKQQRFNIFQRTELYEKARTKVAREIFGEIDSTIDLICAMTGLDVRLYGKYAELKNKYTEGTPDGKRTDR